MQQRTRYFLEHDRLPILLDALRAAGYRCIGPKVQDGAVVYGDLGGWEDLPWGWQDRQAPGTYRLEQTGVRRYFAWAVGPQALKPLLFAPRDVLWRAQRDADGSLRFLPQQAEAPAIAFFGARACDLAALQLQDEHFLDGRYPDPYYAARRRRLFLVAVNCGHPSDTCFCASTGDGPHATSGYDIALTELDGGFVAHAAKRGGEEILEDLALPRATAEQCAAETRQAQEAAARQTRTLAGRNLKDTLFARLDHARWDDVASLCLACGNCTQVCPSCFCHSSVETPGVEGTSSEHAREWDSCFTAGHSFMHGRPVRVDTRLRYRQWLTHKLGGWHDQYGRSGCVGCGRCITWCPVGIDLTEEARALCARETK